MRELAHLRAILASQVEEDRSKMRSGFGVPLPLPEMKEAYTRRSFLNLVPLYLPDAQRANTECRRDLLALYRSLNDLEELVKNGTLWPLQLVDSWGKFADGMLVGNLKLMGFFGECVRISVTQDDADFRGQYCFLSYGAAKNSSNTTEEWKDLRTPMLSSMLHPSLLTAYATCMPSTCTREELRHFLSHPSHRPETTLDSHTGTAEEERRGEEEELVSFPPSGNGLPKEVKGEGGGEQEGKGRNVKRHYTRTQTPNHSSSTSASCFRKIPTTTRVAAHIKSSSQVALRPYATEPSRPALYAATGAKKR
ncbi:hypothetical protein C7M84_000436 [Penaeus vannamei]|uniref:Nose resistant-to-fluoxetine protein N-terminal domain-containing protein n=1 Tax=Penaeus vannamei TaxID=6689 RepID=A0A3R7PY94_PENVA|nr:hypothetical protein C7M84_000436 [Penaeus vannamei]